MNHNVQCTMYVCMYVNNIYMHMYICIIIIGSLNSSIKYARISFMYVGLGLE